LIYKFEQSINGATKEGTSIEWKRNRVIIKR